MNQSVERVEKIKKTLENFKLFFPWLRFFYPNAKGIPLLYLLYFFVPQKIFRINGRVPWPVHFTSRVLYHKNITVGNCSAPGMSACCYVQARNNIKIGHNLRMGPGVGLISSNHELDNYDLHEKLSPIEIGDNVWIGMNTVVLPGISIGDNVAIGSNSVVTENIPSNVTAAGNPCKIIHQKESYKGKDYSTI